MRRLVSEFDFSPEQLQSVKQLAEELSLTETTAGLLYARGMDTADKMRAFLHPSKERFLPPMSLKGMKEAVALLTQARDEEWRVAVFGDYDADGIGACAILSRALRIFGIEPYLYIPERTQGYGMSVAALDKIFDEFLPDLVVTVDCGISNAEEVEYIKEQGAYVIVTDHHELPEQLPDCIVVNPKLGGEYPYDNLCGAGVAFKLACALIGERAYEFVDFAALSTVADSVPLLGENRDIVAEGLRRINNSPRPAFSALLGKTVAEVTAQTLAFTVAPRINAAGRMGDAHTALRLFTSENEEEIEVLAEKLHLYNAERQRYCDEVYAQAEKQAIETGAYGNVIMLAGENWNAGFVGIVAARIAEEFSRPALLFVRHGDTLKGSARSVENVNIFEALKACSEYIEEFGGHAQAAGVNVKAENFEKLRAALNEYLGTHYAREDFVPTISVCGPAENGVRVARELQLLEPFGMGNRRPMFVFEAEHVDALPIKEGSPHLSFRFGGMDYMYFGGAKDLRLLRSDVKKTLVFEYNLSSFRGKESLKGFVRAALADGRDGDVGLDGFSEQLQTLGVPFRGGEEGDTDSLDEFMREKISSCAYGLAAVYSDRATLGHYPSLASIPVDLFRPSSSSVVNTVVYAPEAGCDLSAYRDVVYLDRPASPTALTGRAAVKFNRNICGYRDVLALDCTREKLLEVFAAVRSTPLGGESMAELAHSSGGLGFGEKELLFALTVFEELGLVELQNGRLHVFRGVKRELTDSRIYSAVKRFSED